MTLYIIIGVVIIILIAVVAGLYNSLVKLNVKTDEAWSDITVQLKRRADLIPNLVSTVKGYATHEKSVFEDVANARSAIMSAKGPAETAKADNMLTSTMKSLFAVAENYPELKASDNFQQLQSQITDTEDKIQASRTIYNSNVKDFNSKRKVFPTKIFAGMLGFNADREFFDAGGDQSINQPVQVKF
jgi:LemA protein